MTSKAAVSLALLLLAGTAGAAAAAEPVLHLRSTPQTVVRGYISAERAPVMRIHSGQTVEIDTISHGGLNPDPVAFFGAAGIPASAVLQDAIDISKMPTEPGFGGHVLTGPIYIEEAEPGDMLEIRILKVEPRVPYGTNSAGPGGAAPGVVKDRVTKVYKWDPKRRITEVVPGVEFPIAPFMGIMAVAPAPEVKRVGSRAPGLFGGNLDFKALKAGATLYLPVMTKGGLFVTGDSHAAQGDGEVSGNAIEASMTPTLQFIVHKGEGKAMAAPWAEDADNYYALVLDKDLDVALSKSIEEAIKLLGAKKGMKPTDALSMASVAIDFGVAEAVDETLVIFGKIPKAYFKAKTPYWTK